MRLEVMLRFRVSLSPQLELELLPILRCRFYGLFNCDSQTRGNTCLRDPRVYATREVKRLYALFV